MLVRSPAVRKRPKKEKFHTDLEHFFRETNSLVCLREATYRIKIVLVSTKSTCISTTSDICKDSSFLNY